MMIIGVLRRSDSEVIRRPHLYYLNISEKYITMYNNINSDDGNNECKTENLAKVRGQTLLLSNYTEGSLPCGGMVAHHTASHAGRRGL